MEEALQNQKIKYIGSNQPAKRKSFPQQATPWGKSHRKNTGALCRHIYSGHIFITLFILQRNAADCQYRAGRFLV
jgi:hypothetical protein